jgi:endonuclease/exonuclease/phosphatase family metal-dependent hydrolase
LEKFPNLIILGDFNFPNINWSSKTSATTSNTEQIFVDFLSENSFSQLVNEPTRYRTCQNPSLLDLILTTDENLVTSVKVSSSIEISDHSTIKFDLQLLLNPDKKIQGI